jgi:uncharacterized protein (TIGR01319 family)
VDSHQHAGQASVNGSGPAGDSLLAVDFGATATRAVLFDVVSGGYRFVAAGRAPTTIEPPFANVSEGLRNALDDLTRITGRTFVDDLESIIVPSRGDGAGVDKLVATSSAGPPLRTVVLGLLPDTSVESARRAAASAYVQVVDVIGLGDRRRQEQQVDSILRARPDLLIIAGGTDGGSTEAVMRLAETASLACQLMEAGRQPRVLFMGNAALRDPVAKLLRDRAEVSVAGNVRPTLEAEDLIPARQALATMYETQRAAAYAGYHEIVQWATGGTGVKPTAQALGRLIRFLSSREASGAGRSALGVDLGAASTVLAAGVNGKLWLDVQTLTGVGQSAPNVLEQAGLENIARWLPTETSARAVQEYVLHKAIYPATIPQEPGEVHLELALAREALRLALGRVQPTWPEGWRGLGRGYLPWFDSILATGATLGGAPGPALAALALLDALEPAGIGALLLDVNGIAPALGATAAVEPLALAQVWGSGAVPRAGTFIAPVGPRAAPGSQVAVRVKIAAATGEAVTVEVPSGSVQALPLPAGQTATVTVQPARGFDVGRGPGRGVSLRDLPGGPLGVVVDARGRPLSLPREAQARREAMRKWLEGIGG